MSITKEVRKWGGFSALFDLIDDLDNRLKKLEAQDSKNPTKLGPGSQEILPLEVMEGPFLKQPLLEGDKVERGYNECIWREGDRCTHKVMRSGADSCPRYIRARDENKRITLHRCKPRREA
jgi:hypothetical protein